MWYVTPFRQTTNPVESIRSVIISGCRESWEEIAIIIDGHLASSWGEVKMAQNDHFDYLCEYTMHVLEWGYIPRAQQSSACLAYVRSCVLVPAPSKMLNCKLSRQILECVNYSPGELPIFF